MLRWHEELEINVLGAIAKFEACRPAINLLQWAGYVEEKKQREEASPLGRDEASQLEQVRSLVAPHLSAVSTHWRTGHA